MTAARTLLGAISDAHRRMATNRDLHYRKMQQAKIDGWLEDLTVLYETGEWLPGTEDHPALNLRQLTLPIEKG